MTQSKEFINMDARSLEVGVITLLWSTGTGDGPLEQFSDIITHAKRAATSTDRSTFWRRRRQLNQNLEVFQYFSNVKHVLIHTHINIDQLWSTWLNIDQLWSTFMT